MILGLSSVPFYNLNRFPAMGPGEPSIHISYEVCDLVIFIFLIQRKHAYLPTSLICFLFLIDISSSNEVTAATYSRLPHIQVEEGGSKQQ